MIKKRFKVFCLIRAVLWWSLNCASVSLFCLMMEAAQIVQMKVVMHFEQANTQNGLGCS